MQMLGSDINLNICEPCRLWAGECLSTSLKVADPEEITFWYDYNRDQGGQIEYKSTRSVAQMYAGRKSCWLCARWWFLHRFWDRNGDFDDYEYHSDEEILQQFESAPYHGMVELRVTAEFYLCADDNQACDTESRFRVGAWKFGSNSTLSSYADFQKTWLPSPESDTWFPHERVVTYVLGRDGLCSAKVDAAGYVGLKAAGKGRENVVDYELEVEHLTPDRIMILKGWLKDCGTSHSCLNKSAQRTPTRLLRLEAGSFVRLVETARLVEGTAVKYATLSHCWGDSKADRLLQCDYTARLSGFDESGLTRTNLHAIRICRALSIEYIWIDSLCIIQDSPGNYDWIAEAPKMDSVYGGSYLNISATVARSGLEGDIRKPATPLGKAMRIQVGDTDMAQSASFTNPYYAAAFRKAPVNTRGWIQQEIFLTPRVLHLTDEELVWTCRCALWSEVTYADQVHQSDYERMAPRPLGSYSHGFGSSCIDFDERWRWVARQFAGTIVTVDHDRYMALMGLAGFFSAAELPRSLTPAYVAGCWGHSLLRDIMWVQRGPSTPRWKIYVPSWSWLKSRGTRLSFPVDEPANETTSFRPCAELMQIEKQLEFEELRYGPVVWAATHLRGSVMRIHASAAELWAKDASDEPIRSFTSPDHIWTSATSAVSGDEIFLESANQVSCCFRDINYMTMRMLEICWDDDPRMRGPHQIVLQCIWIWEERCLRSACWSNGLGVDYLGLLLKPVEPDDPAAIAFHTSSSAGTTEPLYRRIGTIKLPVTDPKMHEEGSPAHGALMKLNQLFSIENALVEDVVII